MNVVVLDVCCVWVKERSRAQGKALRFSKHLAIVTKPRTSFLDLEFASLPYSLDVKYRQIHAVYANRL